MKEKKTKLLIILCLCLVIGFPIGRMIKQGMDRGAEIEKVTNRMEEYEEQISTEFPKTCAKINLPVTGTYTAEGKPELVLTNEDGDYHFYRVSAGCAVTLHTDSQFDKM